MCRHGHFRFLQWWLFLRLPCGPSARSFDLILENNLIKSVIIPGQIVKLTDFWDSDEGKITHIVISKDKSISYGIYIDDLGENVELTENYISPLNDELKYWHVTVSEELTDVSTK